MVGIDEEIYTFLFYINSILVNENLISKLWICLSRIYFVCDKNEWWDL